ncbi:MAG: hypothetical protein LWY06_05850 [Firmicutes bacterium]|nr:hypothetical protein [Bacillota bacterium]
MRKMPTGMKNIKGILIFALGFALFLFGFEIVFGIMAKNARERIQTVKNGHVAQSLSKAGMDYARMMIKSGKWKSGGISAESGKLSGDLIKENDRVCLRETFTSPDLANPGGCFEITLWSYSGHFYRIKSVGMMGHSRVENQEVISEYFPEAPIIPGTVAPEEETKPEEEMIPQDDQNKDQNNDENGNKPVPEPSVI